jgi:hypothetical protein
VCWGVPVLQLRDTVSHVALRRYLISFTCTFLSPLTVRFLTVKDNPIFDEFCDNENSSILSGSRIGTPYFGSPAKLPYVSAFIKTKILFIHQLTFYQSGFGGLGVACWPLVHKFAGSDPTEAV